MCHQDEFSEFGALWHRGDTVGQDLGLPLDWGLFMDCDSKKKTEHHQPYPLNCHMHCNQILVAYLKIC